LYCFFLFTDWTSDSHQIILFLYNCFDEKSSHGNRYILKWLKEQRNDSVEGEDFLVYLYVSQLLRDDFTAHMKLTI
jgi:hypothetical protein